MPLPIRVDPAELRLPGGRSSGADPAKLQRQIARFGRSIAGMPPVLIYRCPDGCHLLANGVTRATRVAKLLPGTMIEAEVIGSVSKPCGGRPTVKEKLP
jgi:hypothetical protein